MDGLQQRRKWLRKKVSSLSGSGSGSQSQLQSQGQGQDQGQLQHLPVSDSDTLSILRVGVGIGRPGSRKPGAVADYVLTNMDERELGAVRGAAGAVVDVLVDEAYRVE